MKSQFFQSINDLHNETLHMRFGNITDPEYNDGDSEATIILYATIYSVIIFLVIVLNSITIFSLKPWQNRKRSNVEILIFYISTFDMMASIMIIVDVYELITLDFRLGTVGCKLIYPLFQISLNMSICILMIMTVDRCRSITSPTKKKFSRRSIHIAVFISFVVSTILQMYQFVELHENENGNCFRDRRKLTFGVPRLVITISRDLILVTVIVFTSVIMYRAIKCNVVFTTYTKEKREKVMKKIKMIIVMELVFAVLVVPYDMFDSVMQTVTLLQLPIQFGDSIRNLDSILSLLQMSNSFANFFIYVKMYRYLLKQPRNSANFDENGNDRTEIMDVHQDNRGYNPEL